MTNKQVLAVYNLGKDERVKYTGITRHNNEEYFMFSFRKSVTLDEAKRIINNIFPDTEIRTTANRGQYQSVSKVDICFFLENERE